jgi:hypothetical protein
MHRFTGHFALRLRGGKGTSKAQKRKPSKGALAPGACARKEKAARGRSSPTRASSADAASMDEGVLAMSSDMETMGGDAGSVRKNGQGKRKRMNGMDWDTWRRKRKVNQTDVINSAGAPYEGRGPMLYQDVFGYSGKRVHRRVLRDSWDQMTLKGIKDKTERDAEAYLRALALNIEEGEEYADTPATAPDDAGRKDRWKQDLFEPVKEVIENEARGLHFTGRVKTVERQGRVYTKPIFTNETWRPNLVTGLPEPIPGVAAPGTLSIAEQELLHRYVRDGEQPAGLGAGASEGADLDAEQRATQQRLIMDARSQHASTNEDANATQVSAGVDLLPASAQQQVQDLLCRTAVQRNVSVVEFVELLKRGKVKLSKHQRMLKHVKGFSLETLQRMSNGTFVYNSAWGPTRVIQGSKDTRFGDTWSGTGGGRGEHGTARKRRDAGWFRERALKGNAKAQLQLALCYSMGQGVERDLAKAAGWFARASRQGDVRALTELGMCYRSVSNLDPNPLKP